MQSMQVCFCSKTQLLFLIADFSPSSWLTRLLLQGVIFAFLAQPEWLLLVLWQWPKTERDYFTCDRFTSLCWIHISTLWGIPRSWGRREGKIRKRTTCYSREKNTFNVLWHGFSLTRLYDAAALAMTEHSVMKSLLEEQTKFRFLWQMSGKMEKTATMKHLCIFDSVMENTLYRTNVSASHRQTPSFNCQKSKAFHWFLASFQCLWKMRHYKCSS